MKTLLALASLGVLAAGDGAFSDDHVSRTRCVSHGGFGVVVNCVAAGQDRSGSRLGEVV